MEIRAQREAAGLNNSEAYSMQGDDEDQKNDKEQNERWESVNGYLSSDWE